MCGPSGSTSEIQRPGTIVPAALSWSRSPRAVPDHVMRGAAHGDDVGRAVAVEVAAAQVLGGDVPVEHRTSPVPGRPVEIIHGNAMIGAAVAGEELVVAVAIDIGHPESMALGQ